MTELTPTQESSVSLTPTAIEALKEIQRTDNLPADKPLRVGVKGGGCSGLTYVLSFDEKQELDDEWMVDGIRVIMDKRHALYVYGMEVDYQSGLNDRGFIFNNPNAKDSCGCGTSFSTWSESCFNIHEKGHQYGGPSLFVWIWIIISGTPEILPVYP